MVVVLLLARLKNLNKSHPKELAVVVLLKTVNLNKLYPKKLEQLELARLEKSHPKKCLNRKNLNPQKRLNKSYLKELELPQLL